MGQKSFSGHSIPADFSQMSVKDLSIALKTIEKLLLQTSVNSTGSLNGEDADVITIPLRCLAKVFGVDYTESIETSKIRKAINDLKKHLEPLMTFQGIFFNDLKKENRKERKKIPARDISQGPWPASSHG